MNVSSKRRSRRGQALLELVAGMILLVPIALFGVDLLVVSITNSVNDRLAKDAARLAANQPTAAAARQAAEKVVNSLVTSPIILKVTLEDVQYLSNNQVSVKTSMNIRFPAPFPGFASKQFVAQDVEPVVNTQADLGK